MTDSTPESSVPIWPEFVKPTLEVLATGEVLARRTIASRTIELLELSDAAREEQLESGGNRAENRANWSITHLTKARMIERVARAQYQITDAGREWLSDNPEGLRDFSTANQTFARYWPAPKPQAQQAPAEMVPDEETADPIELIEAGVARIKSDVATTLLERLRTSDPAFFEDAVVAVLLAMGYGGAEQRGKRIGGSGDGGVDGVIDQDALGLDQIYVQAKRYADGNNVGREAIQAFMGALAGLGATRGVFITSSAFTTGAVEYARQIPTRIILIDGTRLAELMIKYRVGVQVAQSYDVVDVDEDFFE